MQCVRSIFLMRAYDGLIRTSRKKTPPARARIHFLQNSIAIMIIARLTGAVVLSSDTHRRQPNRTYAVGRMRNPSAARESVSACSRHDDVRARVHFYVSTILHTHAAH